MGRPVDPNSKTSRILRAFDNLRPQFISNGSYDVKALLTAISKHEGIDVNYVRFMVYKHRLKRTTKKFSRTKNTVDQKTSMQKTVQYVMECGSLSTARQHLDALASILSA